MTEPPRRSVKRNVGVLLVTQVATWVITLVQLIALPRYLGSEAIGQYRLVNSVWLIAAAFIALGTQMLVTLEVARHQKEGASIVAPALLVRVLAFVVVSGGVAAFTVAAGYGDPLILLFVILGVGTLIRTIGDVAVAALQGFEDFTSPSFIGVSERLVSTTLIVVALVMGAGVEAVALISAGTALIQTGLLFRFLRRWTDFSPRTTLRDALRVARRGLPFLFGAFALVAYHELDTIILSLLVADEQIGWYAAADRLMATSLFIPTLVMSALFPTFARLHQEDAAQARTMVDRGFRSLMVLSIPIGFGLATISTPLAVTLFGEEFRQSGPILAVFSVVLLLMFQTILIGNYAVASGRERYYFMLIFAGVVATIPLDLVLIPLTNRAFDNGAIGGALAYIVTESVILIVGVSKFTPRLANRQTMTRLAKCVTAGVVMAAAVWPLRNLFLPVPVLVGAAAYVLMAVLLRIPNQEEYEAVQGTIRQLHDKVRAARV